MEQYPELREDLMLARCQHCAELSTKIDVISGDYNLFCRNGNTNPKIHMKLQRSPSHQNSLK
jgi:hypothetical protein